MEIEILGSESLGVRSLSCFVKTTESRILIDPGVALGYKREGLLPHPVQVSAGEKVREKIINRLSEATDVVISHFHGDHLPVADANPYQLALDDSKNLLRSPRLWIKSVNGETPHVAERREILLAGISRSVPACDGQVHDFLSFSTPMPHGAEHNPMGTVMMTRVQEGDTVFVHASDIQLLADEPVEQILEWAPTILLTSGPAMYRFLSADELARARERALILTRNIDVCIIDHHLLRCGAGIQWLDGLRLETDGRIMCAADFMKKKRDFFESERAELYKLFPVPEGWHYDYARRNGGNRRCDEK